MISDGDDDDEAKISKSLIKTDIAIKNKNNLNRKKKLKQKSTQKTNNKTYKTLLIVFLTI